ncbi:hypothetical protein NPIL_349101 [Nephila pilipes]|uniref:Uncharacterized protein n=1 Tax=Nephila pilipes TaxID=299642 RepID=A0A8X6R0Z7_NEPPI|nr:hypothetical protein NPIL_349101 [Nephila pilipes]
MRFRKSEGVNARNQRSPTFSEKKRNEGEREQQYLGALCRRLSFGILIDDLGRLNWHNASLVSMVTKPRPVLDTFAPGLKILQFSIYSHDYAPR